MLDTSAQTEGDDQTATEQEPADTTVTQPEETKSSAVPFIVIAVIAVAAVAFVVLKKRGKAE